MTVTTYLGTKAIEPDTKVFDSQDERVHACIFQGKLLCIFIPASN